MVQKTLDWRSIVALNAVSALGHIGQFGIPFVVLPVWLEQRGASANQLSVFAACLWSGQLPGLVWGPAVIRRLGARPSLFFSLLLTALALTVLSLERFDLLWVCGLVAGFALGLRWIGLEPWLYSFVPEGSRGRLIGVHGTLVALAAIIAPSLSTSVGVTNSGPIWIGLGFVALACVPIALANERAPDGAATFATRRWHLPSDAIYLLGVIVALFGGMTESGVMGLFPIFGKAHSLNSLTIVEMLSTFGLGGLLLQYFLGWLADRRGLVFASLCCCTGAGLVALLLTCHLSVLLLHLAFFLLGGFVTAYLTLAMIAGAKAGTGTMTSNISGLSITYTISAACGPLLAGSAVSIVGGNGLMWITAAFSAAMIVCVVILANRGRSIDAERGLGD